MSQEFGMASQRKRFRIEHVSLDTGTPQPASALDSDAALRHYEVMSELSSLRAQLALPDHKMQALVDSYQAQIAEAQKLKTELDLIQAAITQTKHEIATVHLTGFQGPQMVRVTHELDAVVTGTENATQRILNATEEIDQAASLLSAAVKNEHEQGLAHDIQDRVIQIFEACNFQDLTGQRITKVVATLKFIEAHIARMMEIWGGIDAFKDADPESIAELQGEKKLINGPKLETDVGHASQDDIDALFG
jgi:chemotaxis protein CheZ